VTAIEPHSQGGYFLPEAGIRCRYLIGADGAHSKVAQLLGLGQNTRFLYGVEAEFPLSASIDPAFLHCFSNANFAPGYIGWALAGPKVIQMGIATAQTEKPDLNAFLKEIAPRFGLGAEDILRRRAGVIPCGGRVKKFSAPRAMLIGDAAGWVSPLTGGGIQLAFRLGRRAGLLVSDYLTDGGGNPADAIKEEVPSFAIKQAMRSCANLVPSNRLLDAALKTRPMRSLAQQIYFHRRGGKGAPLAPGSLDFAAWARSRSCQLFSDAYSDDGPAP
jgi:flavin-dependent dehydrogenase